MEPCGREVSSFNVSAERFTISRQRPRYFERADPAEPEIHRFLERFGNIIGIVRRRFAIRFFQNKRCGFFRAQFELGNRFAVFNF